MEYLPDEILYDILLRASCVNICKWKLTCWKFNNIIDNDLFWKHKCELYFSKLKSNNMCQKYKELYFRNIVNKEAFYGCEIYTHNYIHVSLEQSLRQQDHKLFKYLLDKIPPETKFTFRYWRLMCGVGFT